MHNSNDRRMNNDMRLVSEDSFRYSPGETRGKPS